MSGSALTPLDRATYPSKLEPDKRELHEKPKRIGMAEYSYNVLFEPAEEGGFVVTRPALPGLVTEGDTLEEARAMAQDAILAYLESLRTTNWSHGQRFLKLL